MMCYLFYRILSMDDEDKFFKLVDGRLKAAPQPPRDARSRIHELAFPSHAIFRYVPLNHSASPPAVLCGAIEPSMV